MLRCLGAVLWREGRQQQLCSFLQTVLSLRLEPRRRNYQKTFGTVTKQSFLQNVNTLPLVFPPLTNLRKDAGPVSRLIYHKFTYFPAGLQRLSRCVRDHLDKRRGAVVRPSFRRRVLNSHAPSFVLLELCARGAQFSHRLAFVCLAEEERPLEWFPPMTQGCPCEG